MWARHAIFAALLPALAVCQAPPAWQRTSELVVTPASSATSLSEDQIRQLIRESAAKDAENDKKLRDYTYFERQQVRRIDGKGQVKSTEIKTYDVMQIYGERVEKLTSKDDKPLSAKDAQKEDDKIQKLIDKRRNESEGGREKRLQKEEKEREEDRQFVREVADAYKFRFAGVESLDGRENYVIDADPKPGYQPHLKDAKILTKFRFRAWIDKNDMQWRKLDLQCIDTVSFGVLLFRMHKGSRAILEQTRVNDEVWLQRHIAAKVDFRLALLKNFDVDVDITDRDYKKFRSDTTIIPVGEAPAPR
ncbi:MAG TPA: hypothetical protein VHU83_19790 [Bryobacteraceae bacterium]|jgi:hypothetical protein|nr:hypothetical protein [Bryobacteraceae bacterium]